MTSKDPHPNDKRATSSATDQFLLDDALSHADPLLVESLQVDDDRRRRQKRILVFTTLDLNQASLSLG